MAVHMAEHEQVNIRAFDGSLADAEGVLVVERATFDESPYSATEVQSMLSNGSQRAWVAVGAGSVVGFAIAFSTYSLRGPSWEIDLLAVLPAWRGRRIATRLIREAATFGADVAPQARAFVATDNQASLKAFARAGFQVEPKVRKLLVFQPLEHNLQMHSTSDVTFRKATNIAAAAEWLPESVASVETVPRQKRSRDHLTLILAEQSGQPAGYADLVEVQTLLYRGVWIESLIASNRMAREALVCEVVNRAKAAGLHEIGAMVPRRDQRLQRTLLASGFKSLGKYHWFTAELARSGSKGETEGKQHHA
jgi:ribosomal protein S18 acetylase RimI-like enzyme